MRRNKTITIAEAIGDFIRQNDLGEKLDEISVINSWEDIVGKAISSRTSKIYIKDHILYVHLKSSVVRNELMMLRNALKEKINGRVGEQLIKDIVLR